MLDDTVLFMNLTLHEQYPSPPPLFAARGFGRRRQCKFASHVLVSSPHPSGGSPRPGRPLRRHVRCVLRDGRRRRGPGVQPQGAVSPAQGARGRPGGRSVSGYHTPSYDPPLGILDPPGSVLGVGGHGSHGTISGTAGGGGGAAPFLDTMICRRDGVRRPSLRCLFQC